MPRSLPPSYKRPEPIPQPYFLLDIIPASVLFKPASGSSRASNESFVLCDTSDPVSQPTRLYASHTASINKALQTKPPIAKPRDSCFNPTGQKANLLEPLYPHSFPPFGTCGSTKPLTRRILHPTHLQCELCHNSQGHESRGSPWNYFRATLQRESAQNRTLSESAYILLPAPPSHLNTIPTVTQTLTFPQHPT